MRWTRAIATLIVMAAPAAASEQTVVGGPGNDYQVAVVVPWAQPQGRIAVFERLDAGQIGDLWLTRSSDHGDSWTTPTPIIATAANERHASLVQVDDDAYVLFHVSNATGSFRIHRATSVDGTAFTAHGAIDLGWPGGGEINPQVIRDPDGRLNLVYHRLSGAAYIAQSQDDGVTWDALRTQVSPGNAALPRLARRADDGRYLFVYQTNPGNNQLQLWARTSLDPMNWSTDPVALVEDGNNHDGWPLVLPDGHLVVFWGRVANGGFQIHSSHSGDGAVWSPAQMHSDRPGLNNIQPYALPTVLPGHAELYWGAAQVAGGSNFDIVRQAAVLAVDLLFAHDFEAAPVPD